VCETKEKKIRGRNPVKEIAGGVQSGVGKDENPKGEHTNAHDSVIEGPQN